MVVRWRAVRCRQVEAVWHGAAAIVPRLCGRWPLRLHWRDNHGGRRDHGGDQGDKQHFTTSLQGSRRRKMECCLVEKRRLGPYYVYSNSANSELEKLQNPSVIQLKSVDPRKRACRTLLLL